MSEKVRLVDTHGATSVRIDVEITDEGVSCSRGKMLEMLQRSSGVIRIMNIG